MRNKLVGGTPLHSSCSISGIKWAFGRKEVENVVSSSSSNIWWRGRSYAASVAPAIPDPDKDRKTVPIEARRAMVESFVDKYKSINAGKLPSISNTQKQVGGSFYVVRKILQELQNESTMPSLKSRSKVSFEEKATKETPNVGDKRLEATSDWRMSSSCAEKTLSADDDVELSSEVSHSVLPMRRNLLEDPEEVSSDSHKKRDDENKDLDNSEHVYTESRMLKHEPDVVSDVDLESSFPSEDLKHEDSNCKEQQVHSSLELDRDNIYNRRVNEAQLPTSESKPWGRIKSIVDGIINMWRNL
ncbi:uncharacterized protein LOC111023208 [Momordica charantia]|uniref:Uncharacterized protein LOC111023208 n=1 Tax=Momordica charantia TaxID=3673 RepID=A0A6J1DRM1_MOMCH|nr:uncharacterized protein LOC111023208 [Momordica charantia]XP_022156277.1 uncharacterized protein LOC111023208 [Momordica charantia]